MNKTEAKERFKKEFGDGYDNYCEGDYLYFIDQIYTDIAESLPCEESEAESPVPNDLLYEYTGIGYNQKCKELIDFKKQLLN